jgi:hypothetical protein
MLVGVDEALEVGIAVADGARVRVGFPMVARGVCVGIDGPKRLWQAAKTRMLTTIVIKLVILRADFIV